MPIYLVRHARPLIASGICYGQLDVAADADATQEAAQALAHALPQRLAVWVSPLQRCQQLAGALQALRPDLHFQTDARLVEMHFGCWENVAWADIPPAALAAWTDDFGAHRFGGFESANEVLARAGQAWEATQAAWPDGGSRPESSAVWITHAGVIRAAQLWVQGVRQLERADQWPLSAPAFGQWLCL